MVLILTAVTLLGFARLMAEGLGDQLYQFGDETLRAVQAWENHGFWAWGGFFSLGGQYMPADHVIRSKDIYQSYPPLYLLVYWPSYRLFGEAGLKAFKLLWSLGYGVGQGLLLGSLASSCFTRARQGCRQLVFAAAYVMTISNQAVLRYFMIDEPDYLGLLLLLLGVVLLQRHWWRPGPPGRRPWGLQLVWFLGSWTSSILAGLSTLSVLALQWLRLKPPVQASLRRLLSPLLLGMALYWLQRITVNILYPGGLKGSSLFERMGLIARDMRSHRGVLDALHFLTWQISGSSISDTKVALTQIIEHNAIWIVGVILFAIVFVRSRGSLRQLVLILAAGQLWLFVPLLQLAYHDWIYAIHFVPTVVLGWVGAFETLMPRRPGGVVAPWMLGFVATLI